MVELLIAIVFVLFFLLVILNSIYSQGSRDKQKDQVAQKEKIASLEEAFYSSEKEKEVLKGKLMTIYSTARDTKQRPKDRIAKIQLLTESVPDLPPPRPIRQITPPNTRNLTTYYG